MAFVLTRPLWATVGDFFSKPLAKGGSQLFHDRQVRSRR